ncbi:hypothetical protein [Bacillus toyonensis]|nr:hypothetical protein [Bacillus toyonensis]MBF7149204.1 hypothetical protein [Bacillus toyonensis]MED3189808.1 hypothetical protein [Bacillus toyonensis]
MPNYKREVGHLVTPVSFDTWLYSPDLGYEIEFYHEGEVRIGDAKDVSE